MAECRNDLTQCRVWPLDLSTNFLDVEKIWLSVSDHIEESLVNQIGIKINKLGTFTLKRIELYIGRNDLP